MNDAAKPDCILPIGDDGSSNGGRSSGELIVIKINRESEYNSNLHIGMAKAIRVSRCRFGGINTHSYWKTNLHLSTHT